MHQHPISPLVIQYTGITHNLLSLQPIGEREKKCYNDPKFKHASLEINRFGSIASQIYKFSPKFKAPSSFLLTEDSYYPNDLHHNLSIIRF